MNKSLDEIAADRALEFKTYIAIALVINILHFAFT